MLCLYNIAVCLSFLIGVALAYSVCESNNEVPPRRRKQKALSERLVVDEGKGICDSLGLYKGAS